MGKWPALTLGSSHACPLGAGGTGSGQTEVLVLAQDGAYRVIVTDFIFNKPRFVTLVSQFIFKWASKNK